MVLLIIRITNGTGKSRLISERLGDSALRVDLLRSAPIRVLGLEWEQKEMASGEGIVRWGGR